MDEGSSVQIGVASLLATDGDVQTEAKDLTFTVAAGSPAKGVLQISGADVTSFTQEDINNLRVSYRWNTSMMAVMCSRTRSCSPCSTVP